MVKILTVLEFCFHSKDGVIPTLACLSKTNMVQIPSFSTLAFSSVIFCVSPIRLEKKITQYSCTLA